MNRTVRWDIRDPWCPGYLGLAVLLGAAIGAPETAWLSTVTVLAAVAVGVLRPATAMVWAAALGLLVLTATVLGVVTGERAVESAALASSSALAHAAAIALPLSLVALVRRLRRHQAQGWELARALAGEQTARAESALVQERVVMAGEIHDHLGHRLTLLTVQLGQLTLDPDLPDPTRAALGKVRGGLAEAAGELGETVQLLKEGGMPSRAPADRSPAEVVGQARAAGVRVEGEVTPDWADETLSPHARSALVRVLSEGLANAAKHAPGQVVHLTSGSEGGLATLELSNEIRRPARDVPPAPSSAHGLRSLRHRLSLLGGELEAGHGGPPVVPGSVDDGARSTFVLRTTVPLEAVPAPQRAQDDLQEVVRSQRAAEADTRRARRLAWLVPTALTGAAVALTGGFYVYLAVASTLTPQEFARIEVGMPREEAEAILPGVEMIEAPRDALHEPAGASCRYHEESVSLLAREDVFRICLADGVVVSTDIIRGEDGTR